MDLEERLDKHLQSIKENNSEISFRTFVNYLEANTRHLISKLGRYYAGELILDAYRHASQEDIAAKDSNKKKLYSDSYVGSDVYYFMTYCICNYLKLDSGIDINKAYKEIEDLVKIGEKKYNYYKNDGYSTVKDFDDFDDGEREDIMKDVSKGIKMSDVIVVGDDSGDEFVNPLEFVSESSKVAKICEANQLASKLQPLVKRANWLLDRTYQL